MNVSSDTDLLDHHVHQQVFAEKIAPQYFLGKTSVEHPHAIILGGQPGAGKGGLTGTARSELRGDVVTIDPDELRKFHPQLATFQSENPYTWSGRTHADASQWAKELRQAATEQKKNLIIDTTLGDGDNAVAMIKSLQAQGYEVEVRAIATHWLESELGVDRRFTVDLDEYGFGRYVPADIRASVYDALPATLDQVRTETGVPVSIYNREGLYDSRDASRSA
jgi:hypothetical protein